jgi:hypothetical protein
MRSNPKIQFIRPSKGILNSVTDAAASLRQLALHNTIHSCKNVCAGRNPTSVNAIISAVPIRTVRGCPRTCSHGVLPYFTLKYSHSSFLHIKCVSSPRRRSAKALMATQTCVAITIHVDVLLETTTMCALSVIYVSNNWRNSRIMSGTMRGCFSYCTGGNSTY